MKHPCQNISKASIFSRILVARGRHAGHFSRWRSGKRLSGWTTSFRCDPEKRTAVLGMPDFTHLLGPIVDSGDGKMQTRMTNRLSTVGALISQLPPFEFLQTGDRPTLDDGLALIDGLAFQRHGFQVGHQYSSRSIAGQSSTLFWPECISR